jgi:phage terminase large subunit-like protein
MKSHCLAVYAAWQVTKDPSVTILYMSATSTLAEHQLYAIKGMLGSDVYRRYWPNMIEPDEGKREKWTSTSISVDHPLRKLEGVRDPTIQTAGLTTNTTGWHADIVLPDDVVVPENAYTAEGRRKTAAAMSQISSIKNAGGLIKACGTRYHPKDQYHIWKSQVEPIYDENDEMIGEQPIWEIMERVVEVDGEFIWPSAKRAQDNKQFGFNLRILSRIKAEYEDRTQFFAQYYNNPNDVETQKISSECFQYYDPKFLQQEEGRWFFKEKRLNTYAAIDFAFSMSKKADFTALVTIGVDKDNNIYILDIDRFKTDGKISVYFEHILRAFLKWEFKKLRAETTVAQKSVVNELKESYIRTNGLALKIDEHRPNRHEGNKEERMSATLEPRYANHQMWHYKSGMCNLLEEELMQNKPAHDDIADALTAAVDIAVPPKGNYATFSQNVTPLKIHPRFGGVAYR